MNKVTLWFGPLVAVLLVVACGPTATPAVLEPTAVGSQDMILEGSEWVLASLRGNRPVESATITMAFYEGDYLEGSAGCNSYGIDYITRANEFRVPEIHRTQFSCDVAPDVMQQEETFFEALADIAAYRSTEDHLEFHNQAGETILEFARKRPPVVDPALQGTEWILSKLQGRDLLESSRISLSLDQEGFGGFSGCNQYGGEYKVADGGSLALGAIMITEMDCPSPEGIMEQEGAYVETLGQAAAYRLVGDGLEIQNAAGETILAFAGQEVYEGDPAELESSTWRLATMDGEPPIEGSSMTLAFHDEGLVSGYAGCRDYVATYDASGGDLGFVYMGMMGPVCPDEALLEQEGAYTTALGWTNHYRLTEGTLELSTSRGETLAFERVPSEAEPALEGPTWMLLAFVEPNPYDESPNRSPMPSDVLSRTEITAILEGSRAQGSTGCNSYGASYTRDGSALRFEGITFTEMACLDPEGVMLQEGRFLEYMATVATFRIYGDQLWLETSDGRALVFTR